MTARHRSLLALGLALATASGLACPTASLGRDFAAPALAGDRAAQGLVVEEPPRYGVFYDEPEPSFYTGFAPRTDDPARLHIHLGRGNQLRVTMVLSDAVVRDYARDLAERRRTYRRLIDDGRLELTQNRSFEEFERPSRRRSDSTVWSPTRRRSAPTRFAPATSS